MLNYTVMISRGTVAAARCGANYGSVEDALRGAALVISEGVEVVWIVDENGDLVLPPEQVRSRLYSPAGANLSSVRATDPDNPAFQPPLPAPHSETPTN